MQCPYCSSPITATAKFCPSCGGRLNQSQHLPVGTILDRKYRIERVLGQGGFGITYKATHLTLGHTVAVKEYFPEGAVRHETTVVTNLGGGQEFLAEGQRLATLQHPGIVRVLDTLTENNTVYLVMEFVAGKTLKQLLEEKGTLSEDEAASYIQQAAEALEVIHQAGMLHQDIKPDNLMLADNGRVVLIDFGAARHFQSDKTGNYTRVVTPGYGPLEQYGQQVKRGPYTDIYALGATLYTLLTGKTPPAAPDRVHDPGLQDLKCTKPVREALERAMEISYLKRPQSTQEFIRYLSSGVASMHPSQNRTAPPSGPRPNPSPPPTGDITELVAKGGTHRLGKGRYTLKGPVVIEGDLNLQGEGSDTIIVLALSGYAFGIHCPEGRIITLRGLTFLVQGEGESALLVEGQYDLREITLKGSGRRLVGLRLSKRASGTLSNSYISNTTTGVVIEGRAAGRLFQNTIEGNNSDGIRVVEQASPTLESNICRRNQFCGIAYFGDATGLAKGNTCEGNVYYGIETKGKASPTLQGNFCNSNQRSGIAFLGEAKGLARANTCENNAQNGIQIGDSSSPTIEGNLCRENRWSGIAYEAEAKGLAKGNTCEQNTTSGIHVEGKASPTLEANLCNDQKGSGIGYFGEAKGIARENTCDGNSSNGIQVGRTASPTLEGNLCRRNKWSGIAYEGQAKGLVKRNVCQSNWLYGIAVGILASPTLQNNTCKNNRKYGIVFKDSSTGSVLGNVCSGHPGIDIAILDHAKVKLSGNNGRSNKKGTV